MTKVHPELSQVLDLVYYKLSDAVQYAADGITVVQPTLPPDTTTSGIVTSLEGFGVALYKGLLQLVMINDALTVAQITQGCFISDCYCYHRNLLRNVKI